MLASFSVFLGSPQSLLVAAILLLVSVAVYFVRRPVLGRLPAILLFAAMVLIALTAGEPMLDRPATGSIAVMVDLSPSTRGATFRDLSALHFRIHQLLGDQPYRLLAFGDSIEPLPAGPTLADFAVDRTAFASPNADAILLFSDGQFDLPATGPPTYPVVDPSMNNPGDSAVAALSDSGSSVVATVHSSANHRAVSWTGATALTPTAGTGSFQQYAKPDGAGEVTASLAPGDRWPENDSLTIRPMPTVSTERWWVGALPPQGWRAFAPGELPTNASDYLATSAIVLQNIAADSLSSEQQQRLLQYIRDLGGSVSIVGGDHAFAAGYYEGTPLDVLSPLASSPPQATMRWTFLVDGSGSMSADIGTGTTAWQAELNAIGALLPRVPPNDPVDIGSFAESLSWWTTGKPANETSLLHLPPAGTLPHGPTNLAPALRQIINSEDGSTVVQLLVTTDAETDLPDPDVLSAQMVAKKIHLNVLATGHGSALPALRNIAVATGGSVVEQLDPKEWVAASQILLKRALPARYEHTPVAIGVRTISEWNRTWLRPEATLIEQSDRSPLAATWRQGLGRVTAIAYPAAAGSVIALTSPFESLPHDPRFAVSWENGRSVRVRVNAVAGNELLNRQSIRLSLRDPDDVGTSSEAIAFPQTGPGLYELTIPAPRRPQIATVLTGSQVLDRFAIAGRYPPEFDRIGNNLPNLEELARRTGGLVIPYSRTAPIDFRRAHRTTPLASILAMLAFATIAAALVLQRRLRRSQRGRI